MIMDMEINSIVFFNDSNMIVQNIVINRISFLYKNVIFYLNHWFSTVRGDN